MITLLQYLSIAAMVFLVVMVGYAVFAFGVHVGYWAARFDSEVGNKSEEGK